MGDYILVNIYSIVILIFLLRRKKSLVNKISHTTLMVMYIGYLQYDYFTYTGADGLFAYTMLQFLVSTLHLGLVLAFYLFMKFVNAISKW